MTTDEAHRGSFGNQTSNSKILQNKKLWSKFVCAPNLLQWLKSEKYRGIDLYSDIDAATDDYKVLLEVYGQSHSAQDLCL